MFTGEHRPPQPHRRTELTSRRAVLRMAAGAGLGALAVGPLAACGGGASRAGSEGKAKKIAFVMNGSINDRSWEASHARGMKAIEKAIPEVEVSYVDQVPFGKRGQQTFQKLAHDGNGLIFATTNYDEDIARVASRMKETIFMVVGGARTSENVGSYYVANWDAAYLMGVAAGMLTETDKLGYVASFPISSVYRDVDGLLLGARTVNPKASVNVVTIDSWQDPQKAGQAVKALVNRGVDFVWHILGDTSVPQAAERLGVWSAAWSLDAREVAPKGYVSTSQMDWGPYYVETVRSYLAGTFEPPQYPPGKILPLGKGIDLGAWGDNVPEDVRTKVAAVRKKVMGGFNPFAGPLTDTEGKVRVPRGEEMSEKELVLLDWAVEGVSGL